MKAFRTLIVATLALCASGCVYSKIAIPLDTNLDETRVGSKVGKSQVESVLWMVAWGDGGTQAAARAGGITTLLQADQEIMVVFFGLYARRTTIVYGD